MLVNGERENKVFAEKRENVGFYDEALKKCLKERKGKNSAMVTCKSIVKAFKKTTPSSPLSPAIRKPLTPLRLRRGCLTNV